MTCFWPGCGRPSIKRVWLGDDASGREVDVCKKCLAERFEE